MKQERAHTSNSVEPRYWRRNNAISWNGVTPDRKEFHPPLIKKTSDKGDVWYKEFMGYRTMQLKKPLNKLIRRTTLLDAILGKKAKE